jgi:4-hydroxyphenylpyruvate dioxygenase
LAWRTKSGLSAEWATHVVKNGKVLLALQSPLNTNEEFSKHHNAHGDAVRDVAFTVEDAAHVYKVAVSRGAKSVREPIKLEDKNGSVIVATVQTYGDTFHTFVQRNNFTGAFLPNYKLSEFVDPINKMFGELEFGFLDHVVSNHAMGEMEVTVDWYEKILDFHRYWSIDDSMLHTQYSSLNSIVVADFDETIKLPQNEPAIGKRKSQIQEYVDYYNGSGVQHIAINVDNIIEIITNLKSRGLKLIEVPDSYYDNLRMRLSKSAVQIKEDIDALQKLKILVDYDEQGYLLQIFTQNVEDRPTLFFEFIQRRNHNGFGVGNFKALFEAIERDQEKRGNLV